MLWQRRMRVASKEALELCDECTHLAVYGTRYREAARLDFELATTSIAPIRDTTSIASRYEGVDEMEETRNTRGTSHEEHGAGYSALV